MINGLCALAFYHQAIESVRLEQFLDKIVCRTVAHKADLDLKILPGAEDFTGQIPLQERIDLLYHADFFIGLSSGLSWVANGVGKPVIMISGFTLPFNEFKTPYRLINYHVCNGCWNDTTVTFDHHDFEWCPRHKGTERQFECSRFITPDAVCRMIDKLMADYGLNPLNINTKTKK